MALSSAERPYSAQRGVRCVIMRGGTSKGLYFHAEDLPPAGEERDAVIRRLMGSPDVLQIDGLGGSRAVTSKVAIIGPSEREDADIDYTFAQVDIEGSIVGYVGNCGNISAGVGPFAIDEGLVEVVEPVTTVRIFNTNTNKLLVAKVPVENGMAAISGGAEIAGVPGSGAPIIMEYAGTIGAISGKLLPTGNAVDQLTLEDGRTMSVTVCDVANPCAILNAADLGLTAHETPDEITADAALTDTIVEIQKKTGEMFGIWPDWREAPALGFPLVIMIAPAEDFTDGAGDAHAADAMDLRARLHFAGRCHDSMAGTGATCLTAASRIPGSVAASAGPATDTAAGVLRIGHPMGVMDVEFALDPGADDAIPAFESLGFLRTARRLMAGTAYLPDSSEDR